MEFIPLQIATIVPEKQLTFDLYIHFKGQYLLYSENGVALKPEKFEKLKAQQIARFYIVKEHEPNYFAFLDSILSEALSDKNGPLDNKLNITEGAAATGVEGMQKDPSSNTSYKITQKAAQSLREVIAQNPNALKKIYGRLSDSMTDVIRHSLNVCALSTKLGTKLGLSEKELDDLGTAALIHDIGLSKLSNENKILFTKHKKILTPDEQRIYRFHPQDSAKMLSDKPYVNPEIMELVKNHEEVNGGSGPMKKKKLTLAESILSLCNNYDKRVSSQKLSGKVAMKEMQIEEVGNYDLKVIKALGQLLQEEGMLE